jgi:hypothetical protein
MPDQPPNSDERPENEPAPSLPKPPPMTFSVERAKESDASAAKNYDLGESRNDDHSDRRNSDA